MSKRFQIALSFPGENRQYVSQVAEHLAAKLGQNKIFYDQWHTAELAIPDLDIYLQEIYHVQSELIVPFLCVDYENKQWCGLEWRAIRDLLKNRQTKDIMPMRFDNTNIPGLFSIDGYVDLQNYNPEQTADLILQRLYINRGDHGIPFSILSLQQRIQLTQLFAHSSENIRVLCRASLPGNQPYPIPRDASVLELLEWLIERGRLDNNEVPLLTVLSKLIADSNDYEKRDSLQQCRDSLADYFGVAVDQITPPPTEDESAETTNVLMLEIVPLSSSVKRCSLQAWLFHKANRIDTVCVRDKDDPLDLDNKEEIELLLNELQDRLIEYGVDDDKSVLLEFVLPQDFLSESVEHWTNNFDEPVGAYYSVVVRCRERLRDRKRQNNWKSHWQAVWNCCQQSCRDNFWWMKQTERKKIRGYLNSGRCVAMDFVPDLNPSTSTNVMEYLLRVGTPVALWPRINNNENDLPEKFHELTEHQSIENLPEVFRDMRYRLWSTENEDSACYHITLLWDDPTRGLPDFDNDYLQAPV